MFVGADGCKKQWLAIKLIDNDSWEIGLFQDIYSLWDVYRDSKMILVDVPIGLREKDDGERLCDKEARRLDRLGKQLKHILSDPNRTKGRSDKIETGSREPNRPEE